MTKTAKSLVMKPQYRQKVVKALKGKGHYTRKLKHKDKAGHSDNQPFCFFAC